MHPYPLPQTAGWGRQSCSHHCCTSAVGSLGGVSLCLPGRCLGAAVTELYLVICAGRWWLLLLCSGSSEPLEHARMPFCHARFALQPLPGSTGWEERPLGAEEPHPGWALLNFQPEADAAQLLLGFSTLWPEGISPKAWLSPRETQAWISDGFVALNWQAK